MRVGPTLVLAALITGFLLPGNAHDLYSRLRNAGGESCCDDTDCRPVPYRIRSGGVQMLIDGDWIDIPRRVIQYQALAGDTGEADGGHWCGSLREAYTSLEQSSGRR
jgi:hypothetical protein